MQVFRFFLQNLIFDAIEIRFLDIQPEVITNLTIFVHELKPDLFSEHVATNISSALVDEEGFLVKRAIVSTNNNLICKPKYKFLQSVYLETDVNLSFGHEDDFLDFFKFSENYFVLFYLTRLQAGEDFHHEFSVVLVRPVVEEVG